MDRRDFLKTVAGTSYGALALASLTTTPGEAEAAHHEGSEGSASAAALAELRAALGEVEQSFRQPAWHLPTVAGRAEARSMMMHTLQHALEIWFSGDPERPVFKRFVTPEKKLLGDNPDAIYFNTLVDPAHTYRIRGNLADATYTSFTVEIGTAGGANSQRTGATLNDTQFTAAADGSYDILVSAKPQKGNWLRLDPGAGSISTRHYYERKDSIAADRLHHIPLVIDNLALPAPPPPPSDESVARGIRRVANFLRSTIQPPQSEKAPAWVSRVPNQLPAPRKDDTNKDVGFAAVDNVYSMAVFALAPDEALVMRGHFPKCRFASVVLWNRFMQTLDYTNRRTSLNRQQTILEDDGSFRMVLAGRNPSVPNWIDTEGRSSGLIFWRFLLPEGEIEPLRTEVVKIADLWAES